MRVCGTTRRYAFLLALAWLCTSAVAARAAVGEEDFNGRVVSVIDGDTVRIRTSAGAELNVRLEGIDCPESGQPFGGVARRFTRVAVFDEQVIIRPVTHDAHGRLVARIIHADRDLSLELVTNGLAWQFTEFSHDPVLASAERDARRARRGLWSAASPIAPWVWRRQSSEIRRSLRDSADAEMGPFFGNTSTRVFHAAKCRNAHCKNCTTRFLTAEAAVAAGYRPSGDCLR
jgi:micrococcal nuclease